MMQLVVVSALRDGARLDVPAQVQILALEPGAQAALRHHGRPFLDSLEFYGADGHAAVLEASSRMIERLLPAFEGLAQGAVHHAIVNTLVFHLRFRLHYWLTQLYILDRAVASLGVDELTVFSGSESGDAVDRLDKVASAFAETNGLTCHLPAGSNGKPRQMRIPQWVGSIAFELALLGCRLGAAKRPAILVAGPSYGMPCLAGEITNELRRSALIYLTANGKFLRENLDKIWRGEIAAFRDTSAFLNRSEARIAASQIGEMHKRITDAVLRAPDLFRFCGVDLGKVIRRDFVPWLAREALGLHRQIKGLRCIVQVLSKPVAGLAQHALGQHGALGEVCLQAGIPSLLVTHGSHVPQSDAHASTEWTRHAKTIFNAAFSYTAVQTPWAERFLEQQEAVTRPLRTGPLLFANRSCLTTPRDELRRRIYGNHADKTILLHAGTPKGWRSNRPWVYETVDEYIRSINHLIDVVEQTKDAYLAIRFRPMPGLNAADFATLIRSSASCGIHSGGGFEEHLLGADLLVSYSSTTIEEALQNEVPVLLYDPDNKYSHLPAQSLVSGQEAVPDMVYHVGKRTDLPWALDSLARIRRNSGFGAELDWTRHRFTRAAVRNWLATMGVRQEYLK